MPFFFVKQIFGTRQVKNEIEILFETVQNEPLDQVDGLPNVNDFITFY